MGNFTFYPTIPATNNNPSTDQPNMQTNNQSNFDIWEVDHVGFGASNGGTHDQVTFSSNNVPSLPTTPPVLFTSLVGGLAQLFYYTGTTAQSSTQYVSNANGSTMLMGGIILKWGTITPATATQTFTYASSAFPNATFSVILQATTTLGILNPPRVTAVSATGFTIVAGSGIVSQPLYYIAIGN